MNETRIVVYIGTDPEISNRANDIFSIEKNFKPYAAIDTKIATLNAITAKDRKE